MSENARVPRRSAVLLLPAMPLAVVLGACGSTKVTTSNRPASVPQQSSSSGASTTPSTGTLKSGTFPGQAVDTRYGPVQVGVTVSGGRISGVDFLAMPNDRPRSQFITQQAEPLLRQEVLQAQSANIDLLSGATYTSEGFAQSLQSALSQAH
jgi:uncharacterized protein with FMN-binding domain